MRQEGIAAAAIAILAVLAAIGVGAAAQQAWLGPRPPPEAMAGYHFHTCAEARRAHAAPLVWGEPWYRSHLDADHDGVACEFHLPTAIREGWAGRFQD